MKFSTVTVAAFAGLAAAGVAVEKRGESQACMEQGRIWSAGLRLPTIQDQKWAICKGTLGNNFLVAKQCADSKDDLTPERKRAWNQFYDDLQRDFCITNVLGDDYNEAWRQFYNANKWKVE